MDRSISAKHHSLSTDSTSTHKPVRPLLGQRLKSVPPVANLPSDQTPLRVEHSRSKPGNPPQPSSPEVALRERQKSVTGINLAILGRARVGKSTFIRGALDLDRGSSAVSHSKNISVDGQAFRVQLYELEWDDVQLSNDSSINWPEAEKGDALPAIHGVLFLYDITHEKSVHGISQRLHALCKARLPVLLIASKSDAPMVDQEVGIAFIERVRSTYPSVNFAETSSKSPQSSKRCLTAILNSVLSDRRLEQTDGDISDDEHESKGDNEMIRHEPTEYERTYIVPSDLQSLESDDTDTALNATDLNTPESSPYKVSVPGDAEGISDHDCDQTPPNLSQSLRLPEANLPVQLRSRSDSAIMSSSGRDHTGEGGKKFLELVNRLLQLPATKNEAKFVPAFLCLFRLFATPKRLLRAIIDKYTLTAEGDLMPLAKVAELLRYLQVLAQWTANYPGDFATSSTRRLALSFTRDLEQNSNFAPAAKEIIGNLLTVVMDDDQDWAYDDKDEQDDFAIGKAATSAFSIGSNDPQQDDSDCSEDDKNVRRRSFRNSGSASTNSSFVRSSVTSSQSATNLFNLENAREQSRLLKSVPHIPLSKTHWHLFMSTPNEEIAREVTRMDWTMFSAIRARDFIRHVSLSNGQRARLKHGDIISMMVKHFNHLALFVSGMILFRDKPKHRARILEKFMDLAWKVRQLNNYNSLGAIVAGITGPEISRLSSTYELVPVSVQRQFLRLTILMSHSRSYSAYRMAWENSFSERIPFIPLVRQDLTLAASANSTFIGRNINWKKFEIMGDVIVGIHRCHEQPYHFHDRTPKGLEITRLILETKIIHEAEDSADPRSELFDRSMLLEPHTSNEARKTLVGFGVKRSMTGWFHT